MTDLGQIGKRIYEQRVRRNWTQSKLAKKACISVGYLSEIERARKVPSLETLFGLAGALNVPPAALVPGDWRVEQAWRQKLQQIIDLVEQLRDQRFSLKKEAE